MTPNETILAIVANSSNEEVCSLVTEWCNCTDVEIDDKGDIWVANPQTGHWLNDERKAEFVAFCESYR